MLLAHAVDEATPESNVCGNAHFRIEPCVSYPIAGYLIVSPQVPVLSLSQLSSDARASLGSTLAAATHAIEVVAPSVLTAFSSPRRPARFIFIYFRERTGYSPGMRALIRAMNRYRGRGFSIGRARHSDLRQRRLSSGHSNYPSCNQP